MIKSNFDFAKNGKEAEFLKTLLYDEEEKPKEIEETENLKEE